MTEYTLEQKRALALARARKRKAEAEGTAGGGSKAAATAKDMAKSYATGVGRGAIALAGLPGTIKDYADQGGDWLIRKAAGAMGFDEPTPITEMAGYRPSVLSGSSLQGTAEAVTGPWHRPQTTAGKYAGTVGEFVGGSAGGGSLANAARFAVAPAVASEAAGQATEGSGVEPYARAGAALLTGGGAAVLSRPSAPAQVLRQAVPNLDEPTLRAAQQLMDEAAQMGSPLTVAEAIQQVTNSGTRLGDIQRVVEQSSGGAPIMKPFMAARPAGVQQAGHAAVDRIGPRVANPSQIAPRVQMAAQGVLDTTRQTINRAAEPYYRSASTQRLYPGPAAGLQSDPAFIEALRRVRADRIKNGPIAHMPDDSIAVVNEVKIELDTMGRNAANPMNANRDMRLAGLAGDTRTRLVREASRSSPDYAEALRIGRTGRRGLLEPMRRGPVGELSRTDDFSRQSNVLMAADPLPGSQGEIRTAVRQLTLRDPGSARDLVRTRLEQALNEATQDLVSGPNQFGGAKFRSQVAGNPQQFQNLEAVVTEVAGRGAWDGLNRALRVFEAQGRRQPAGSQTEFNRMLGEELKRGGVVGYSASAAASPSRLMSMAKETYDQFQYGRNTEQLARLLVDPRAVDRLRNLALMRPNSPRARAIATALAIHANQGFSEGVRSPSSRVPRDEGVSRPVALP